MHRSDGSAELPDVAAAREYIKHEWRHNAIVLDARETDVVAALREQAEWLREAQ